MISIPKQPKLLILIYTLIAILAVTFAVLLYLNPWTPDSTPVSIGCDSDLAQADLAIEAGHTDEAERLCLHALKLTENNPDNLQRARVFHALGLTYFHEEKLSESKEALLKAIDSLNKLIVQNDQTLDTRRTAQQKYAMIEGDLASVYAKLSRNTEAESTLRSALKRNDLYLGSMEVQRNLSENLSKVLRNSGKTNESEDLKIEAEANDLGTKDLLTEINIKHSQLAEGKLDTSAAIRGFKAVALSAQRRSREVPYVEAEMSLVRTYLESGQLSKANREWEVVFNFIKQPQRNTNDQKIWMPRAMVSKAILCQLDGKKGEAQEWLKQAEAAGLMSFIGLLQSYTNAALAKPDNDRYFREVAQLFGDAHLENYEKETNKPEFLAQFATLYNTTGFGWLRLKQYDKANEYFRRSLSIYNRTGQGTSARAAELITNLARVANQSGNYTEAQRLYNQALARYTKVRPASADQSRENSALISMNLAELGSVYANQQNFDQAEIYYKKAFENDVKSHNWGWLFVLGQYHQSKNEYKQAKLAYGRALAVSKTNPATPKETISLLQKRFDAIAVYPSDARADLLEQQGAQAIRQSNLAQANAALREASKLTAVKYGDGSLEYAQCCRDIGDIYYSNNQWQNASEFYERAYAIFDAKHIAIAAIGRRMLIGMATSYLKRDSGHLAADAKKAVVPLTKLIDELIADPDAVEKPLLSSCYVRLAECYVAQKMYVEAEQYYNKALEFAEKNLKSVPNGPNKCALANALQESASNYVLLEKYELALPSFKRAIKLWETVRYPPSWDNPAQEISQTRVLMANALRAQQKSKPGVSRDNISGIR